MKPEDFAKLLRPGLHFLSVRHDDGCPSLVTQSFSDCTCAEVDEVVVSEEKFIEEQGEIAKAVRAAFKQ